MRVTLTAPDEPGAGAGSVTVALAGGWTDRLFVPVRYEVRDVLAADPPAVFLGAAPAGARVRGRAIVAGLGPLELTAPPALAADGGAWGEVRVTAKRVSPERFLIDLDGPLPTAAGRHEAGLRLAAAVTVDGVREDRALTVPVSAFVLGDPPAPGAPAPPDAPAPEGAGVAAR